MHHRCSYGDECSNEFIWGSRSGRAFVYERYYHLHCIYPLRPVSRFYGRWCWSLPWRLILLSAADVCIPCDSRFTSRSHLYILTLCAEKTSRSVFGNRSNHWRCYHGSRLFAWQSLYLQHSGVCHLEAAVSDITGIGWRSLRYDPLLEMQTCKTV